MGDGGLGANWTAAGGNGLTEGAANKALDGHLDYSEVREALERIISSDAFRTSPQLIEFLRYVVNAALRGEGHRVKAYTIGIDVLGRPGDFDPQLDPIVRVEATRLRHAIDRYYAGPGADDTIGIEVPRGTYVPVFSRRKPKVDNREVQVGRLWRKPNRYVLGAAAFILLVVAMPAVTLVDWRNMLTIVDGTAPFARIFQAKRPSQLVGNGMPALEIEEFESIGTPSPSSISPAELRNKLQEVFSRFDAINISAISPGDTRSYQDQATRHNGSAEYRLAATIRYGQNRSDRISFRLTDLSTNTLVWSKTSSQFALSRNNVSFETKIAAEIGGTLLQPFGVIRARERLKGQQGVRQDPRYVCILKTFDAFRSFNAAQHIKARNCLERLTADDATFPTGLPYLAALYNREYLFGLGARPGTTPPLDRGLSVARRGVELAPSSARAFRSLFVILFNRKDIAAAFAAGDRAIALNPYDPTIVSEYGGRLVLNGEIERGLDMMRRAATEGPVRPSWHHYFMFLGSYFAGNLADATFHAEQLPKTYPLAFLARLLATAAAKDTIGARANYEKLSEMQPEFRKNPRVWLEKFFTSEGLVDKIISEFAAAGLVKNS